jgi:hypothetical protein
MIRRVGNHLDVQVRVIIRGQNFIGDRSGVVRKRLVRHRKRTGKK